MFANQDTFSLLQSRVKRHIFLLETAIDESRISASEVSPSKNRAELTILWVGRIEKRKALDFAIDVIHELRAYRINVGMDVVGDGPDLERLRGYSVALGLGDSIRFLGKVAFSDVDKCFSNADLFLFTSVQDTSGNVVLEAMAQGLPVVAFKHQGALEMLRHGGGVLVDVGESYDATVADMANVVKSLTEDKEKLKELRKQGKTVVRKYFTWEAKGKVLSDVYT